MKNEGWIDSQKHDVNVRILSMNPSRFWSISRRKGGNDD